MHCRIPVTTRMLAGILLMVSVAALAAPPAQLPSSADQRSAPDFTATPFDREAAFSRRSEVHEWLLAKAVEQGLHRPLQVAVSQEEKAEIDKATGERPPRVGLSKAVSARIDFGGLEMSRLRGSALTLGNGAIEATGDGGFVYTTSLTSPGAAAMRVRFTGFDLPPQTGLYLYNDSGEVFGPYTRRGPLNSGQFWSHTVAGDYLIIQLHHVGQANDEVLHRSGFNISEIGHLRPRLMAGFCDFNASCVENAECYKENAVTTARDAVADMLFVSGAYFYICTGGLLNDNDESTDIPHFLTAHHCISKGTEADSLETFFGFTTPCGTSRGDCPGLGTVPEDQRTLGSTITSSSRRSDYSLLQLSEPAPEGTARLGWSSAPVAFSNGEDLHRISHPKGAPQAYSAHEVDTSKVTCRTWPRGEWIYSTDTTGATEGGSSGSPVVNGDGLVVGQLSGGCGYDVQNVCNWEENATVDGAFAAYFDEVAPYLDPGDVGGCTPVQEICNDEVDNDCDGLVDADDPDCDTGGGGLGKGEACTDDGECASGKCRGKPGAMSCK